MIEVKTGSIPMVQAGDDLARQPMNHHHRKTLHALFDHPISANISFKEIERVLEDLGATLEARSGDRLAATLKGHTAVFHKSHHSIPKDEIVNIRHFLESCGVSPAQYPV